MGNARRAGAAGGSLEPFELLHAAANRFGGEWTARKTGLLERCARAALDDAASVLAYHDILLFMLAYPESAKLLARAKSELRRVARAARAVSESRSERVRARLVGTGIAWSSIVSEFSFDVAAWFAREYPQDAEIDGPGDRGQSLQSVLKLCLLPIEAELLEDESADVNALLDAAKGASSQSRLQWLVAQLERLPSARFRERLFESLQLFLEVTPRDGPLSRTFARGLDTPTFFHKSQLFRDISLRAAIDDPVPPARTLTAADRRALLATARGLLANLGRETDAITAATPATIEYRELGRGVAIALFAMPPERRFPLDTHLGFVLFKNSLPVAYGGGWPFLEQCKIGVNVFAPYRGGESAHLFCQVLRVYRQRFDVERFVVEPYQFGAHNREGLLSGAFWFYYRLGFRPAGPRQAELAKTEFERIRAETAYRSSLAIMRRLTRCNLELRLGDDDPATWPDPVQLSLAASAWIGREFAGDRNAAEAAALKRVRTILGVRDGTAWPEGERDAFRSLGILIAMIPDLNRWSERERRGVLEIMRAKGAADETRYFRSARRHPRLRRALFEIAQRFAPSIP